LMKALFSKFIGDLSFVGLMKALFANFKVRFVLHKVDERHYC